MLCGKGRDRTQNLGIPSPALCQLHYKPDKSDCTTCLLIHWGCRGPLGRTRRAVFGVPIFEKIGVCTCLATATKWARMGGCTVCTVYLQCAQCAQCAQRCTVCTENPTSVHATSGSLCPGCMEQAVPNLTAPRVYQSPGGAGARWAGLDELFFGFRFLRKSVFAPVLPRPQNGPGSSR